jgi:23S rRNA G2445 N2-methylase RlmL
VSGVDVMVRREENMLEKVIIGNAELWLGDCREVLPMLPTDGIIVSDPPYGIAFHTAVAEVMRLAPFVTAAG